VFSESKLQLQAGDLLCLYSDGVTEATSPSGEEYGQDRLEALLRRHLATPLPELRAALDAELREIARGLPQGDDQTVLLLRRA
jgi:serine phosphatase RsbU (regulator of sigma subunit)